MADQAGPSSKLIRKKLFRVNTRLLADSLSGNAGFGCLPGIRTPIDRFRADCPTIERGGNRFEWSHTNYSASGRRFLLTSNSFECTGWKRFGQTFGARIRAWTTRSVFSF